MYTLKELRLSNEGEKGGGADNPDALPPMPTPKIQKPHSGALLGCSPNPYCAFVACFPAPQSHLWCAPNIFWHISVRAAHVPDHND